VVDYDPGIYAGPKVKQAHYRRMTGPGANALVDAVGYLPSLKPLFPQSQCPAQ
jgi:hypothetical protein